MSKIEDLPRFFILGRTRSGTTMLRSMLDAHPNILVPPEFPVLTCVRKMKKTHWAEREIDQFVLKVGRSYKFSFMKITTDALRDSLLGYFRERGEINLDSALNILDLLYISPFDKKEILQLGNKNPRYSLHVEKIRHHFPRAKFIFMVRHILSVLESVQKVNFELRWPAYIAWRWKRAIIKSYRDKSKEPYLSQIIRYEDLVQDQKKVLGEICSFLQVPFDSTMLNFNDESKLKSVYGNELDGVHSSLLLEPGSVNLKDWTEKYSRKQKIAIAWAGKSLMNSGYTARNIPKVYYYILGIPSVLTARFFLLCARILNFISFGYFPLHINSIIAQVIYKNPNKTK